MGANIPGKPRVFRQIPYDGQARLEHDAETDRPIERRLAKAQTDLGLEPLPAVFDQADQCDRRSAQARGKLHQAVEFQFRRRVEDPVAAQGGEPVALFPTWEQFIVRHEAITTDTARVRTPSMHLGSNEIDLEPDC